MDANCIFIFLYSEYVPSLIGIDYSPMDVDYIPFILRRDSAIRHTLTVL